MLQVGDHAPDFTLMDQNDQPVTLSSLRGKPVILFFYPKADTPGCTTEACGFQENRPQIEQVGAEILGISPDPPKKQKKFADKFGLSYPLLADVDHTVSETYGVWAEKSMYGRKYMGIDRSTFLIDAEGKISAIFQKVKVKGHAEETLRALQTER